MVKFIDFLNKTEWYDRELLIDGIETEFSFVWDNDMVFTPDGLEKFSTILNGTMKDADENTPCLEVTSLGASEELIELFNAMVAGYVADSFYNKMLTERKKS